MGGISLKGPQDGVLIKDNTVILGILATSDIFIQNNFGAINDVSVDHNFLGGDPGYNLYVEGRLDGGPVTNITVTNNWLVIGHYGAVSLADATPTFSGNMNATTGQPLPLP
jgi:hypothetical protein